MATRSRHREFTRFRGEHYGYRTSAPIVRLDDEADDANLLRGGGTAVEMNPIKGGSSDAAADLPQRWSDIIADVRDIHKDIETNMSTVAELQRRHLGFQFGVGRSEDDEEREIEVRTKQVAHLFKEMETLLMLLEKEVREDKRVGFDAQRRMADNMKVGMVQSANVLSRKFRDSQRIYLQRLTKQKEKKSKFQSVAGGAGNSRVRDLDREEVIDKYLERGLTQDQIEMMIVQERSAQERDSELKNILTSIVELHEMFRDMNTLVIEQGSVLDQIDHNLNVTREKVEAGVKELSQAQKYQGQTTWKLCFLLLCVLIIGFAVALAVKASS
eukprot:PhM_4_TR9244/c0_g1_i1/m.24415/K08489/STX16; syntaxin 16